MVPLIFGLYLIAILLQLYAYRCTAILLILFNTGLTLLFFWHHVTEKIPINL